MGKYRMNEPYGYQEVVGFTSLKSEMDGEMSSNKKTDEQQSAEIKAESEAREKADKQLDARVKALEEASGGGSSSDIEDKVDELEQAVNTLNGTGEGSVKKTAEDAAAAAVNQVVDDAPEMYDTLREVATYIATSEEEKTEMKNSISSLEDAMDDKADKSDLEDVQVAVSGKADSENVYTRAEVDETVASVEEEISAFSSDIASLNAKDDELQGEINSKAAQSELEALSGNVYTKDEADGKFLTEHQDISGLATKEQVAEVDEKVDAIDLTSYATQEWVGEQGFATEEWVNEQGFIKEQQSLDGYATEEWVEEQGYLKEHQDLSEYATTTAVTAAIAAAVAIIDAKDGEQDDAIAEKANVSDVYTKAEIDGADFATEAYVSEAVEKVVGAAPENFDTLKEIADALADLKVVDVPAVEGEHYTQEEIDAAEPGDDAYGKTTDDWKVEPVEEVSHNMTIAEFVNTMMQEVNEKPEVNALNEKVNALENALKRVDANAYQTMMNDLEVLDTLKDANSVTITEGTIADIVVPETTRSKTINGELDPNSTVSLTSRYGLTINNSGSETTNVEINAPAVEGYNAATVTLNGGEYDTITLTDASLTTNTAATIQNVVITEETTKALTINAMFEDGATVTSYSDAPITLTNKNAEGEEASITINASGSTVTLSGGKWEVVEGSFSDDTLIIKKFAKIKDLTVTKGNVIVEVPRQSDIASVITGNIDIAEGYTIDYNKVDVTQDNMSALKGTAECTLQGDITTTTAFVAPLSPAWDTVWNLNGHTMEVNTTGGRGGLMVRYSSSVEFNGPGTFRNNTDYGVWLASTGGTLTINGGTFEAKTHVVYAQQGVITINGGVFKFVDPDNEEKDENGNFKFLVNCLDSSYSSKTANVIIKGGKFYGWNPSASYGEPNAPANFVAAGFHVVETVEDGMNVYEVVED